MPQTLAPTTQLNVTEIFSSIQGETSSSGLPTTFIRLSSCNLRCSWCDTDYSFSRGTSLNVEHLLTNADLFGNKYVCITGGEPLLQKGVHLLMELLCDKGYNVSIETGGSLDIKEIDTRVRTILDIKCPGSEMEHKNLYSNLLFLKSDDEIKFVIKDRKDYDWAVNICIKHKLFERNVLFAPVYNALNPEQLAEWVLFDKLQVRLNLQIHKIIWPHKNEGV